MCSYDILKGLFSFVLCINVWPLANTVMTEGGYGVGKEEGLSGGRTGFNG